VQCQEWVQKQTKRKEQEINFTLNILTKALLGLLLYKIVF
jgi:hypothetical protein